MRCAPRRGEWWPAWQRGLLTGRFPRHERKDGEGGYGCWSPRQDTFHRKLILRRWQGLSARPFGHRVFDDC